ncbi:hypothetical protein Ndes2526B_g05290 [Nannochloris sp. 'desiccata']|nr:hypothetical protein KSW81_003261 [Chlorella desiccata (nom. nud.)]KAG7674554.1 hypothetical protein KSW81_000203 [Chlorella desiccata (nom. nud.)]KAH7617729.1 hypothetical protein NADE_004130 [Chlorella desiccata (nom. nud.)]KAH7620039.1 hypothetical protein NADE_008315 [Chlorella desiccata (nom. nud.)]
MSASAAGGRRLPPLSKVVNTNKVVSVVAGATLLTYVFTEIRFRASAKAGKVPITLTNEWRDAQNNRMFHTEFESAPDKRVVLNPHRHNVAADVTVHPAA